MIFNRRKLFAAIIISFLGMPGKAVFAQPVPALLNFDGTTEAFKNLPRTLSGTGFDPNNSTIFIPYGINVPQFQNLMKMNRYLYVPPGQSIIAGDTNNYLFPTGTVFFSVVFIETSYNDSSSRLKIECQVQVRNSDSTFNRLTYLYNENQSDAELVEPEDYFEKNYKVSFPAGALPYLGPDGSEATSMTISYERSAYDCVSCHSNTSAGGFFTQQLNKDNQLDNLQARGILIGVFDTQRLVDNGLITKWYNVSDLQGTMEQRVRSGLAVNCANCHNSTNKIHRPDMGIGFEYYRDIPVEQTGIWSLIVPGRPDSSELFKFIRKYPLKNAGLEELVWQWVNSLDGNAANDIPYPRDTVVKINNQIKKPEPVGRFLLGKGILEILGSDIKETKVQLFTIKGEELNLQKLSKMIYKVNSRLVPGWYIVKINDRNFLIQNF